MPEPTQLRASTTRLFSLVMVIFGIVLVVRTVAAGGGPAATGVILGVLFAAAGLGRLYLQRRG